MQPGDLNIFTQVALVVLVGLACKNAILIVEFAKELEEHGEKLIDAVVHACRMRLRPILMTSIAFCAGVLPLILGSGAGSEMRRAMGIAVFSGMVGVTLFGIFLTPVFYVLLRSRARAGAARRGLPLRRRWPPRCRRRDAGRWRMGTSMSARRAARCRSALVAAAALAACSTGPGLPAARRRRWTPASSRPVRRRVNAQPVRGRHRHLLARLQRPGAERADRARADGQRRRAHRAGAAAGSPRQPGRGRCRCASRASASTAA